jgi:hypothetical protein
MKINLSDKIIAWLALLSGLTISAVAIWYSVAGLVSIFAAAMIPIIVMGVVLEISKLIATVWLKLNWQRAPVFIRSYLLVAIAILMVITSMGIFGFLSKAHSDQSLVSGDVQSRIAVYDEKIKTAKDNIDANRKALKQMDEAVDQVMGRSQDEKGADKAVALRRGQQKERARLQTEIQAEQKTISKLSEERAPIAAEVRKVEAEVGPIKYIAAFVYGDNPDANVLEKAVTWVIIIIVSVFDPLAVILLIASQYSFQWFRQAKEEELVTPADEPDDRPLPEDQIEQIKEIESNDPHPPGWMFDKSAEEKSILEQHPYLNQPFAHFENLQPIVHKPEEKEEEIAEETDEELFHPDDSAEIKAAKTAWKHDHPNDSLKRHKKLYDRGLITQLPWESYLPNETISDNEAAIEAAKWAQEQLDERPGDYVNETYMENVDGKQVKKPIDSEDGYVQNEEQSASTIWNRVKKAKGVE